MVNASTAAFSLPSRFYLNRLACALCTRLKSLLQGMTLLYCP